MDKIHSSIWFLVLLDQDSVCLSLEMTGLNILTMVFGY